MDRYLQTVQGKIRGNGIQRAAVPRDFTFVDVQAPFRHVSHASLGLLGGEGVEVVNKGRLVRDLKVPDAAVALETHAYTSKTTNRMNAGVKKTSEEAAHLSAQVHYVGVGVIEGQQDSVTGVHLLDAYRFVHAVLETQSTTLAGTLIVPKANRDIVVIDAKAKVPRTVFHKASWRSLMRLNPVVKMFPSARKMALIGRAPS